MKILTVGLLSLLEAVYKIFGGVSNLENKTVINVIVAEDEELIRNSIIKKIHALNMYFNVIGSAQDGKEALELIEKYSPDILITDIQMPVMNGLELLKIVASKYPHIIKIVVSGFDEFKYAQQALKYEVKDYLLKPLNKQALMDTLGTIRICFDAQKNLIKQNILNTKDNYNYSAEEIAHLVEVYIKENFAHEINFELIAQNFNFNASYLSKLFTKHIGENPSKYLISLRINKAKHLLLNQKELSVREIGEIVGYPNQYHFSHMFKIFTGKSPANYKEDPTT
jgi:two-component system, response regulator YesN